MRVEGKETNDEKLIRDHIDFHFKELFGQPVVHSLNMVTDVWPGKFDLATTTIKFSKKEIRKAIWGLNSDKSLGPDGFPILFYRIFWNMIKEEFVSLFEEIFQFKVKLERLNYSQDILISNKATM